MTKFIAYVLLFIISFGIFKLGCIVYKFFKNLIGKKNNNTNFNFKK